MVPDRWQFLLALLSYSNLILFSHSSLELYHEWNTTVYIRVFPPCLLQGPHWVGARSPAPHFPVPALREGQQNATPWENHLLWGFSSSWICFYKDRHLDERKVEQKAVNSLCSPSPLQPWMSQELQRALYYISSSPQHSQTNMHVLMSTT